MTACLVTAANTAWNIVNFRAGLISQLKHAGFDVVVAVPPDSSYSERMAALGVEQIDVELDRSGLNPFADVSLFFKYWKVLRRLRPAAFLSFTIKPNIYGCLAARILGIPAIANVSGLGTAFSERSWLRRLATNLYRVALKRAHVFFQNADDMREFVEDRIVLRQNAQVLPGSGIDLKEFVPEPLPDGGPIFLLVARLLVGKGVREFVAAAQEVRREFPDARFRLLGPVDEGNPTAIKRDELDSWIAEGVIEYLGVREDVRGEIAKASVMVLPSFYREGVPRSLLEGAAMARPLISTDTPGCRELVVETAGGLACAPRDVSSLVDAMRKIARMSATERTRMGLAARSLVEERFSEERVVHAYLAALASAGVRRRSLV
ncbi:glycosyltransferase family 4 protein [Sphingomonas hankyongi]|uniref:Glycosyltransferase family 4 protein n=1 Tax=Sphingomonas hankyongi TaxID=2908209 RepID=A0ABT0S2U0_9SPHN|nr:glycosyltransferase family 4 protein [Sphingomonas hankyongi]MCL6730141.1 glycosyltransferase family 4 protein [Sphingomonas hankyongi]